jgi:DNA-binding MarR family transcriptional regulator
VEVGITPAGLKLLAQLSDAVQDCHKRQLGHLPARDLKQLVELLQTVRQPHEEIGSSWRKP